MQYTVRPHPQPAWVWLGGAPARVDKQLCNRMPGVQVWEGLCWALHGCCCRFDVLALLLHLLRVEKLQKFCLLVVHRTRWDVGTPVLARGFVP
jgi:hypothetical protein